MIDAELSTVFNAPFEKRIQTGRKCSPAAKYVNQRAERFIAQRFLAL
jgi:hypothetical protein